MSYISLYRKWRPKVFDDIIGQEHVVRTLKNAIEMNRISHAFLFSGPRGTGKTSMAKILARAVNCENGPTTLPCGLCASCVSISDGSALDVIEIDAASNRGIDEMRDLREKVRFTPSYGKYKVYIIDEAHMLTTEASNALLKTLEEPPKHTIFILATTEPNRILPTIHSRCQRFDFRRLSVGELTKHLTKVADLSGIKADQDGISLIARRAEGGVRDALSILDQAASWGENGVTLDCVIQLLGLSNYEHLERFIAGISSNNLGELFCIVNDILSEGADLRQFLSDLIRRFMNILVAIECPSNTGLIEISEDEMRIIRMEATKFTRGRIAKILEKLSLAEQEAKRSSNLRLTLELALTSICLSHEVATEIESRLSKIESGMKFDKTAIENVVGRADEVNASNKSKDVSCSEEIMPEIETKTNLDFNWQDILVKIKERNMPLYALLEPVIESSLVDNILTLGFKPGWPIHYSKASESKNIDVIIDAIKECLGREVTCKTYIVDGKNNPAGEMHVLENLQTENEDPNLKRAKKLFDPIEISIEEDT